MNKEQKMYNIIIKDFVCDVLMKNDIKDPIEIFNIFCDLFRSMTFSKDTNEEYFNITRRDLLKELHGEESEIIYNSLGELVSDKMNGLKNKKYLGMFMVNGDGVCRHINSMLADILRKMGYKTYILYGPTNNGDINSINHAICAVIDNSHKIIYLDAMERAILYETDKNIISHFVNLEFKNEDGSLGYTLKAMDYSLKAPHRIDKFVYYKSKFKNNEEINNYLKNINLVKESIYKDALMFRKKHSKMFEEISEILHEKYDSSVYVFK